MSFAELKKKLHDLFVSDKLEEFIEVWVEHWRTLTSVEQHQLRIQLAYRWTNKNLVKALS